MKTIYFLSILLIFNFSFSKDKNKLKIDAKYTVDSHSTYTLASLKTKTFLPFINNKISIGYNNNASIWCVFNIKNSDSKNDVKTWLCIDNNHIDSLFFYDGNKIELLGDRTKFVSPFMKGQCFGISLLPNENRIITVKLKKETSFFEFAYQFENENTLALSSLRQIAMITLFLGSILFLLLFNTILYLTTRNKLFLKFILYSILTTLYISIISNYLKNVLFNEFIYFSELQIYTACFWFISLSYFMIDFLDLKKNQPKKYKIIYFCNSFIFLSIIASLFLLKTTFLEVFHFFFFTTYISFLIVFLTIFSASFVNYKINKKISLYVLFAFLPHFIWSTFFVLNAFEILESNFPEDWVVYIGLYEVLFFGCVLAKNYIETFQKNNFLSQAILAEKESSIKVITQVQIKERRTISNIIHDNLGSKIAYILQLMQLKQIELANENLKEIANEIREISHSILPKSLDDGILIDSLQSQIKIINSGFTSSKIELYTYDFPEKVAEPWVYDLYLISLEIINNSIKHGKASSVIIEFYGFADAYTFQFSDNGAGFNTNDNSQGYGLDNIEKRILYYKGVFDINSTENNGVIIQICIPK